MDHEGKLRLALVAGVRPEVRKRLAGAGMDVFIRDSRSMMTLIRSDFEKYGKAAKAANIRAE